MNLNIVTRPDCSGDVLLDLLRAFDDPAIIRSAIPLGEGPCDASDELIGPCG
jgi:radical SAM superfamily enzyme